MNTGFHTLSFACTQPLAKTCRVYSLDLRFHGDSGRPTWVRPPAASPRQPATVRVAEHAPVTCWAHGEEPSFRRDQAAPDAPDATRTPEVPPAHALQQAPQVYPCNCNAAGCSACCKIVVPRRHVRP